MAEPFSICQSVYDWWMSLTDAERALLELAADKALDHAPTAANWARAQLHAWHGRRTRRSADQSDTPPQPPTETHKDGEG